LKRQSGKQNKNTLKHKTMKTKITGIITALLLFLSITVKAAEGDPYKISLNILHERISNAVASLQIPIGEQEDSETYLISFEVKPNNQLTLVSIEGSDEYVSKQIHKKLDNLKVDGAFDHTIQYQIKVVFKKNQN